MAESKNKKYLMGAFWTMLAVASGIIVAGMVQKNLLDKSEDTAL
tara:strand:+ start:4884 stop:5015 length:132 start_codon:yes stop_codon:yes gene_type:complete